MSTQMTGETQEASVVPLRMPRADGLPQPAPEMRASPCSDCW